MSLLSDLINGKQIDLSDGSKISVVYKSDANVLGLTVAGNTIIFSDADIIRLMNIFGLLRRSKDLETTLS